MPIKEQMLRFNDTGAQEPILIPVRKILQITIANETPGSEQIEVHFEQQTGTGSNERAIAVTLDTPSSQRFLQDAEDLIFGNYTGLFNV